MHFLAKKVAAPLLALLSTTVLAVTDDQVFAYAEANFPSLFAGTVTAGQFQQYNYRHYQASNCFLAVDTAKVIYVLGACVGETVTPVRVGPVADFADAIIAWEAAPSTDYSGTWSGTYLGLTLTYQITQAGANLTLRSVPTLLTASQTYTGSISGNTAHIATSDYATATATLTAIDANNVRVVQDSCVASQANAIYCLIPVGTSITFTRQ
jgi:hypothetical protein